MVFFYSCTFNSAAQKNYEIRKIVFHGNETFDKTTLLDNTSIYESSWFSKKIQKKEAVLYNPELTNADTERIRRFYQSEGFLYATVKLDSVQTHEKKQTVNLYFSIQENKPVVVDKLLFKIDNGKELTLNDSIVKRLLHQPELTRGKRFIDQRLYNDVERINNFYKNRGYIYVDTRFDLKLKPDSGKTDILYQINRRNLCQFGASSISGNRYIKEQVIRRQLNYKQGNNFSKKDLESSRKQMYSLQLFKIVSLSPQTDNVTRQNPIPVQVYIQEMPRWSSKFGLGYGTEDKFRAYGDFTYRGLFWGTSRLNLYLKHSSLLPYYASLSWIEPRFLLQKLSLSLNPYVKREAEPGYTTNTYGINLPATYSLSEKIKSTLTYYIEKVIQIVESDDADVPNPEDDDFLYNKSGLSATLSLNNARPIMNPEKGWILSLGAKVNGYIFGSDFDYTKFWTDARMYQKVERFSLAERVMIGAIHSADASDFIPVEDRWYSGGSNSNRGWGRSEIGPKRESGTPLGGKSILETNIEVRHPLFWRIQLAAFVDASNVWTETYYYDLRNMDVAVGGGLRIDTPIGPIRFDIGAPVWNEKHKVQFYLSVGQAF
ncbi:MAG: BamA/TamA family outer membrane protein [Paludibacter sp.]|nr:BamA/TamA family outer membrane protein [Paludibacter sp.]